MRHGPVTSPVRAEGASRWSTSEARWRGSFIPDGTPHFETLARRALHLGASEQRALKDNFHEMFRDTSSGHSSDMRLAGFDVRSVAVAELALRLHQEGHFELAQHVGLAVDTNQRDLKLTPDAARIALDTIGDDEREELATLRDALTRQIAERAIGRKLSSARRSVRRWVQLERGYGSPLGH